MKRSTILMGMPITLEIVDAGADDSDAQAVFDYLGYVDRTFSTYDAGSEISRINRSEIKYKDYSADVLEVLDLAEETRKKTNGFFDVTRNGLIDPSGIVKGWAIRNAAAILKARGRQSFFIEAGGDIEARGTDAHGKPWKVGIRNPFSVDEIVKVLSVTDVGIATSGMYLRGEHIYNPHNLDDRLQEIASVTVVARDVYDADRFATAAFAMGKSGIMFLEETAGLEGYVIEPHGIATETSGFDTYL